MNEQEIQAKLALDNLIRISRTHLYKPIQIAEILFYNRQFPNEVVLDELETYRTRSKRWRDEVTLKLVGNVSTSNSRYQDDLFNEHAIPPHILSVLGDINRSNQGMVESYIYYRFRQRQSDVLDAFHYLFHATPTSFQLQDLLDYFEYRAGLKRSVDKAYEMVTYALFSSIIDKLDIWITLEIRNTSDSFREDFSKFLKIFFDDDMNQDIFTFRAQIFRNGVTNAADRGLDMWANFGTAIQVKHVSLNEQTISAISENIRAEHIVVVCKTADKRIIDAVTKQLGLRIKGIVTQDDLNEWYDRCFTQYRDDLGVQILDYLRDEFRSEFSYIDELENFLQERKYSPKQLIGEWQL